MTVETTVIMTVAMKLLYNLALVAGTAFLMVMYNWSGWWFLLTIALMSP